MQGTEIRQLSILYMLTCLWLCRMHPHYRYAYACVYVIVKNRFNVLVVEFLLAQ